jgi:hypothetical protein
LKLCIGALFQRLYRKTPLYRRNWFTNTVNRTGCQAADVTAGEIAYAKSAYSTQVMEKRHV